MKEIIYNYEEFAKKIDKNQPIHHNSEVIYLNNLKTKYKIWIRVYAVTQSGDFLVEAGGEHHIIMFEGYLEVDALTEEFIQKYKTDIGKGLLEIRDSMVEKYAKPLGSTEGRLEP